MKIARIDTFPVEVPLKPHRRMVTALGRHDVSRYLLVRISTDAGIEGAGEATVSPLWSGETTWGAKALIDRVFSPLLIGADPCDVEDVARIMDRAAADNWFAKSAVEMACWDIAGKEAGRPVYELLGGAVRPLQVRCRFSMGACSADEARRWAAGLVEEGFTTIKVKVGAGPDPAGDIERVRAVREAIGPQQELVIDANCGWDAETAIAACRRMDGLNVSLFEQPAAKRDHAGMARVRREVAPQVCADDSVFDHLDAVECIRAEGCDVISVYPGKNGGILKTRRIVEYAAEHGVACSIGSNLEYDVATAAMCHTIVALKNIQVEAYPGDMLGPDYHEARIVKDPIEIHGPLVTCPDKPGLGVEVDWRASSRFAC